MPTRKPRKKSAKKAIEEALATTAPLLLSEPEEQAEEEPAEAQELRQAAALSRFRHKLLGTPVGLTGKDAETHADKELADLLPLAVAELKDTLLHSSSRKERMEAAKQVLDSTGRGKSERSVSTAPSIVINLPGGSLHPWRSGSATIEGEVTHEPVSSARTLGPDAGEPGKAGGVSGA